MAEGLSVVILAGGDSRRMGRDKASLSWGGKPMLQHVADRLRPIADEVVAVTGGRRPLGNIAARVVFDLIPDAHAIGGLYTGLRMACSDRCFVCACDMPFVNAALARFLARQASGVDCVIPKTHEGLQPLHAVYNRSALPAIEQQIRLGCFDLKALAGRLSARIVDGQAIHALDPSGKSFLNLNTPEEFARHRPG